MSYKLLFFASDYKIGLSSLLTEEVKFLAQQSGLDVVGVGGLNEQTVGLSDVLSDYQIPIQRIDKLDSHKHFSALAKRLFEILCQDDFSYVHVQNNWQLALITFVRLKYKLNYKVIYTVHGYRHNNYVKSLVARFLIDIALFSFADIVLVSTSVVKSKFILCRKKIRILPLGVEDIFYNAPKCNFDSSHINLIFAGQFRTGKNQHLIIEAVSKYINKTNNRNFTVYLAGEGHLKQKCIHQAMSLHVLENIQFPGQLSRKEMLSLYNRCQIAIVPTNFETFGHCIAEPFVLGMCVISRKVGIVNDLIVDGVNGLTFDNSNDLALVMEKYLCDNKAIQKIGNETIKLRDDFKWTKISLQYKNILDYNSNTKHESLINVLYFASDYKIGLSNTLSDQAKSISQLSEVKLTCIGGDSEQEIGLAAKYERLKIPLLRISGLDVHKNFFYLKNRIADIITKNNIQIVHIHNNWQLALVAYIKMFIRPVKIVYSIHGYRHNNIFKAFFAKRIIGFFLSMFADKVFAGSNELKKALPFIKNKSMLLTQGVEDVLFKVNTQKNFDAEKNIVFIGQFRRGKNHDRLITTFYNYSMRTGDYNYKLYLAGTGKLQQKCINQVNNLGLSNNVVFTGQLKRTQVKELYETCQIAVVPTNFETFGYCIAEPYVAGLCVFTKRTGIAEDIISHEKSGLLFDTFEELEDLLVRYLQDNVRLAQMAKNTSLNRNVLNWEVITDEYKNTIKQLIES